MASNDKLIRIILKLQDEMSGQLNKASGSLDKLSANMTKAGKAMTIGVTAPLVAIGAASVKAASDLDTAMRNVQSITGQTDKQIAEFSARLVDMSTDITKTVDSAEQLAEGLYAINSAGFTGEEGMKVLEVATKAATAGLTETTRAAEGIDSVLNAYNLTANDAAHVSDLMFTTVQRGVGTFDELTGAMSNVVGTANAANVGFDTVSAAITTMSKSGMSFSEASVALNQSMLAFLKPSTEMTKALQEMGYSSGQAAIDALGFDGALQAVSEHVGGSAEAMSGLFGNVRALRGALALTGSNAQKFGEDMQAMAAATGATDEAFAAQTKSFDAQMKNFRNTFMAMAIEIGQIIIPVLTQLMQAIIPIVQAFRNLPEGVKTGIVAFAAVLAAVGPVLIILGQVIGAISAISGAFGALSAAAPAIGAAIGAISLPVLALVGAVGALAFALNQWQKQKTGEKWGNNFKNLGTIISLASEKAGSALGKFASNALKVFSQMGNKIGQVIQGIAKVVFGMAQAIVQGLINGIKSKIQEWFNTIKSMAEGAANIVKKSLGIKSPSKVMMGFGQQVVAGFNKGIDAMGGLAIPPPTMAGATVGAAGGTNTVRNNGVSLAGSGAAGGGIVIQNLNVPPGTSQEQIRFIMKEIGKEVKRRGGGL